MKVSSLVFWWSGQLWYVHFKRDLAEKNRGRRNRIAVGCGATKIEAIEDLRALKAAELLKHQQKSKP